MICKRLKQMMAIAGIPLAVNTLLLLGLGMMNRPRWVASPRGQAPLVIFRTIPESEPPRTASQSPPPLEPQTVAVPDEVSFEPAVPEFQPVGLGATTLDTTVRLPRMDTAGPSPPRPQATDTQATSRPAAPPLEPMREGEVDTPPRPVRDPQPAYPETALRRGVQGHVTVELLIDRYGAVSQLRIAERRGPPSFEQAVRKTILSTWGFEPGRHRDRAVPTWVSRRIEFRIRQ